jgi:hypothetical protein
MDEDYPGCPKQLDFNKVQDSGKREEFKTGAVRDMQKGKGLPHLLPTLALRRLAKHFENGAVKYGKNNWRKGIPLSSYMDSIFRHWCAIIEGKQDEDHASAISWNAACFTETVELINAGLLPKELDDIDWIKGESSSV